MTRSWWLIGGLVIGGGLLAGCGDGGVRLPTTATAPVQATERTRGAATLLELDGSSGGAEGGLPLLRIQE